jgi:hypothetical protein
MTIRELNRCDTPRNYVTPKVFKFNVPLTDGQRHIRGTYLFQLARVLSNRPTDYYVMCHTCHKYYCHVLLIMYDICVCMPSRANLNKN